MSDNRGYPIFAIFDMCRFSVRGQQRPRSLQTEPEIQRTQLFARAPGRLSPFLVLEVSLHTELDELLCFETECVASDKTPLTWHVFPLPAL